MKKIISVLLTFILVISTLFIVPFTVNADVKYKNGDLIEFGAYPQSKITDTSLISNLNDLAKNIDWKSYGYMSGTGVTGSASASDYMRYVDVELNNTKYRGVVFDSYRYTNTNEKSGTKISYVAGGYTIYYTNQDSLGYKPNTVYWFKYEPIVWRILDVEKGLIVTNNAIDSQPFSNTIYENSKNGEYYKDNNAPLNGTYANNYYESSIRKWLTKEDDPNSFYNIAFNNEDKEYINTTFVDNQTVDDSQKEYSSFNTNDKVFLLNYQDAINSDYFSNNEDRYISSTDYAKSQNAYKSFSGAYTGNGQWLLRTPADKSGLVCEVTYKGTVLNTAYQQDYLNLNNFANNTDYNIRPAIQLSLISGKTSNLKSDYICSKHSFNSKASSQQARPATCTLQASYYVQCDNCKSIDYSKTVKSGNPNGHIKTEEVIENNIEADCTTPGSYDRVVYCKTCGIEISRINVVVPANGHKFDNGTIITYPTCTSEGSMIKKCLNDGCDYQETVSIPKKDHTYTSVVTVPTCKEQGYTTYTCSKCGNAYKGDYVATVEHSFKDYKYNNDATCTTDGTKTATCEYGCGTTDTVTAPNTAIGHKFVENEKYCTNGCKTLNQNYKDPTPTPGGGSTSGSTGGGGTTSSPVPNGTDKKDDDKKPETKPNQSQNASTSATQKLSVKKLVSKKKALVVYWNKIANVSGYQIQVATDKKFKKNKKTVTVAKQNASKKTVKKLKAKKKYFVRVRAYKIIDGKKSYGKWSKIKTVKTK